MKLFTILFTLVLVSGCASQFTFSPNEPNHEIPKKIGVFFDGTNNDSISNTNVNRLRNLVYLQEEPSIHTIYINGVGTEGGFISQAYGMITGWGFEEDAQNAFIYLGDTYREENGDQILVFGFSRGSYTARVLAGLIAIAGVPDFKSINESGVDAEKSRELKEELVERVFSAYASEGDLNYKKKKVAQVSNFFGRTANISFMGLWDTVPAIGVPDFKPDTTNMTERMPSEYYDQLCNIDKVAHATSIDDNRAKVFDSLLLTYSDLIVDCKDKSIDNTVDEVWFSGAHSDVGGGYNTDLSGVSLNWMIGRINKAVPGFLPNDASVFENIEGESHIPSEILIPYTKIGGPFGNRNRSFMHYASRENYNNGKARVHKSVIDRIAVVPKKSLEFNWGDKVINNPPKYKNGPDSTCVQVLHSEKNEHNPEDHVANECSSKKHDVFVILDGQECFDIVDNDTFVYPDEK